MKDEPNGSHVTIGEGRFHRKSGFMGTRVGCRALDVAPAGDRSFGQNTDIEETPIEPIAVGSFSVRKDHLHRRNVIRVGVVFFGIK